MKNTDKAAARRKITPLCGRIARIALLLVAVTFTLCACLGTEGQEIVGGSELSFTTADSEETTVKTVALSDLLARSKANASETGTTATETVTEAETAAESVETVSETAEPPETEPLSESAADADTESGYYILNTNSKKFHFPSCASVETIKPKNKSEYTGARENLIAQGYAPCKRCNP